MKRLVVVAMVAACGQNAPARPAPSPPAATAAAIDPTLAGTAHPMRVVDAAADGAWIVLCQARRDTSGDGKLEVFWGPGIGHGKVGDAFRPYVVRGAGPGDPIDVLLGASRDGHWLAAKRDGKLAVLDVRRGTWTELPGGDVRDDNLPIEHRAVVFAGDADRMVYFRGDDTLVVRDLASGVERSTTVPGALLWRATIDRMGQQAEVKAIVRDTNGDGARRWPGGNVAVELYRPCQRVVWSGAGYGYLDLGDDEQDTVWIDLDTGVAGASPGPAAPDVAYDPDRPLSPPDLGPGVVVFDRATDRVLVAPWPTDLFPAIAPPGPAWIGDDLTSSYPVPLPVGPLRWIDAAGRAGLPPPSPAAPSRIQRLTTLLTTHQLDEVRADFTEDDDGNPEVWTINARDRAGGSAACRIAAGTAACFTCSGEVERCAPRGTAVAAPLWLAPLSLLVATDGQPWALAPIRATPPGVAALVLRHRPRDTDEYLPVIRTDRWRAPTRGTSYSSTGRPAGPLRVIDTQPLTRVPSFGVFSTSDGGGSEQGDETYKLDILTLRGDILLEANGFLLGMLMWNFMPGERARYPGGAGSVRARPHWEVRLDAAVTPDGKLVLTVGKDDRPARWAHRFEDSLDQILKGAGTYRLVRNQWLRVP